MRSRAAEKRSSAPSPWTIFRVTPSRSCSRATPRRRTFPSALAFWANRRFTSSLGVTPRAPARVSISARWRVRSSRPLPKITFRPSASAALAASGFESTSTTSSPPSTRAFARARPTSFAPRITHPVSCRRRTPRSRAMRPPVSPATTTVTAITRNTRARSASPPGIPARASSSAKRDATAAATMPRGPIHPMKSFWRMVRSARKVPARTHRGRTTRISAATTASPAHPRAVTWATRTSAARSTKSIPMSITVSCSLNSSRSRCTTIRALPTTTPATLTAAMPLSGMIARGDLVEGEDQAQGEHVLQALGHQALEAGGPPRAPRPPARPMTAPKPSRETTASAPRARLPPLGDRATSRATTAMMAPMASMSTPSASRTVPTLWITFTRRSRGLMTVGPVTITRVPKRIDIRQGQPRKSRAAKVPPTAVTTAPRVMRSRMAICSRLRRRRSRLRPPSKRITATAKPTRVMRAPPRTSGRTRLATSGPRTTPVARSKHDARAAAGAGRRPGPRSRRRAPGRR